MCDVLYVMVHARDEDGLGVACEVRLTIKVLVAVEYSSKEQTGL
jgi:hypothetical protein